MIDLKELLEITFPVAENSTQSSFRFFPICNEYDFCTVIDDLALVPSSKKSNRINVAILFGESHFISLLPTLARLVDMIILADIEVKLHLHNKHLLSTFRQANTISKFLEYYCANFPSKPFRHPDVPTKQTVYAQCNVLFGRKSRAFSSLKTHHFLSSMQQYQSCKLALERLSIVQIHLNLADPQACLQLSSLLRKYQAQLTVCNFTNIHHYVEAKTLRSTTSKLLRYSEPAYVLYSTGPSHHLTTHCTYEFSDYLNILGSNEPTLYSTLASYIPCFFKQDTGSHTTEDQVATHKLLTINKSA